MIATLPWFDVAAMVNTKVKVEHMTCITPELYSTYLTISTVTRTSKLPTQYLVLQTLYKAITYLATLHPLSPRPTW